MSACSRRSAERVAAPVRALPHVAFSNVFGQTETTGAIAALGPEDPRRDEAGRLVRAGSVGKPLPRIEIRILDPQCGEPVAPGEVSELEVRSRLNAEPGWRRTGDLVRQDVEGHLYPFGRLSETLHRGGEKFAPTEVEAALASHPQVVAVVVAGVPDADLGEGVGAAGVRRGDVSASALREHARQRLAPFQLPERILVVEAIPNTEFGKVRRRDLAERIVREGHLPQRRTALVASSSALRAPGIRAWAHTRRSECPESSSSGIRRTGRSAGRRSARDRASRRTWPGEHGASCASPGGSPRCPGA